MGVKIQKQAILLLICFGLCVLCSGASKVIAKDNKFYFAYGSNMDQNQMKQRCITSELFGRARLNGYQFVINGRGVGSIEATSDHVVEGILWSILPHDEAMLDLFEGVAAGYYLKKPLLVEDSASGELLEALVYIGTDSNYGKPRSGYLEKIITAAEAHEFCENYLEELRSWQ